MITFTYDLDVVPGAIPVIVPLKQYEDDVTIVFNVFSRFGQFDLGNDVTASIRGTKPDENGISVDVSISGNVVTIPVIKQMTAADGKSPYELVFSRDGKEFITASFYLAVQRAALDEDTLRSDSVIKELASAINRADQIIEAARQVEEARRYVEDIEDSLLSATTQALEKATNAENEAANAASEIANLKQNDEAMQLALENKFDGAYDENGYLYMTSNGAVLEGPLGPFAGGGTGGGTGGNNAKLTVTNVSGFLSKTISDGQECEIVLDWSSIEDGMSTGKGRLSIVVNGSSKAILDVEQGLVPVDVAKYLSAGANVVRLTISDLYGNSRTINFSITSVVLSITSTFDTNRTYPGPISFAFTPIGNARKTIHFIVDGVEIGTMQTSVSGRQQSYTIPHQGHGAHSLLVYFDAEVGGQLVPSNELYFEFACTESNNDSKIAYSQTRLETVEQFNTVLMLYSVYDPKSLTTPITLYANGTQVASLVVDRTEQKWSYKPNTVGELVLEIKSDDVVLLRRTMTVTESSVEVEAETEGLSFYLSSYGRSNLENNPGEWTSGNVSTEFSGFNFVSDGWQLDEENNTVLRVSGDARLNIPVKIFENDFRDTGKTIEIEFASRNVLDYDAVIMSCLSGGRGFVITSQRASFMSSQSEIGTLYKENEHVRLTLVVERRSGKQLLMIYLNGILSGVKNYPDDDDFSQTDPIGISVGSNDCTIDLYCIRVYENALARDRVVENWIADTQDGSLRTDRYLRNAVYDDYGVITIGTLKKDLPYLVINCPVLPSFKGDKKTCSGYYVDPVRPEKSFSFENAIIDVQGTSSQYYYVKNWKISFDGGFILANGITVEVYQLNDNVVATNVYTMKADVASSEGANNVVLAQLYNELCPVKTPPQESNSKVRQTIDGHPIAIFWDNGTDDVQFIGKYNFNHDKGTPEVFGFSAGDESWEILQNGTDRVGFHSADFTDPTWKDDFEARYPDKNTNMAVLSEFAAWVVSTDTTQATDEPLNEAVTYGGVEYTHDSVEYRLAKFEHELPEHANVNALVFYYVFTEVFLCIDQREKNAFPTFWFAWEMLMMVLFYDADSSLGTDNKGNEAFDYWLEDIDFTDAGDPIYNGQNSVLWVNLRNTKGDLIRAEYQRLRTTIRNDGSGLPLLSYDVADTMFENHQSKWSEAIFNEDGYKKSIEPFLVENDTLYLPMLRGKKELQRKYWLYNRFRYLDSKYVTGTSMSTRITIRAHARANVYLTSYVNMYGHVYFNAAEVEHRMMRGQEYEFVWPASGAEDPVIGINDADMLTNLGDLSPLMVELIDLSPASHLTHLKVGDASEDFENLTLNSITFGNNVLLRSIDVRNCKVLTQPVSISGCTNVEEVYFDGTAITSLTLPNGGILKKLHLPETIKNLTIRNQSSLTEFVLPASGYSNIETLWIENVNDIIPTEIILAAVPANSRIRLIGFDWEFDSAEDILSLYDRLDTMRGLDENGNNMDKAQLSGILHVDSLTGAELAEMQERYPYITVQYNHITSYLYFYDDTGENLLAMAEVQDGGNGAYEGSTPTKESTAQYHYTHSGWSLTPGGSVDANALNNVTADRNVYAAFTATVRTYTVTWNNGNTRLETDLNQPYGTIPQYNGADPVYNGAGDPADYEWTGGWTPAVGPVSGNTNYTAAYRYTGLKSLTFIEGTITEYSNFTIEAIPDYSFYECTSLLNVDIPAAKTIGENAFKGCSKLGRIDLQSATRIGEEAFYGCTALRSVVLANKEVVCVLDNKDAFSNNQNRYFYVPTSLLNDYKAANQWSTYSSSFRAIEDYPEMTPKFSWDAVFYHIDQDDYATFYKVGDAIPLDLGTEGLVNMQIAAFNADDLADGSGKAHISFISKELLATSHRMNPALVTNGDGTYQEGTGTIGGWEKSEMRTYLNDTILPLIPETVRNGIVNVTKTQPSYNTAGTSETQITEDDVWIPSLKEVKGTSSNDKSPLYYDLFLNRGLALTKKKAGASVASIWWTRTSNPNSKSEFTAFSTTGGGQQKTSNSVYGACLGFCV